MKLYVGQGLVVLGLAMGLAACGPKLQSVSEQDASTSADPSRRETVKVGINFAEKGGLRLADATSYSMSLEGCASGLTYPSITDGDATIDLYKFDQGCLVKLNSFNVNTINYVPSSGDPFTSWATGDLAVFEDSTAPANKLTVKVISQLPAAITGTETVSYAYTQVALGTDESIAKSVVSDSHTVSVGGVDAANVDITAVTMTGMTALGAGQFRFDVTCLAAVNSGSCGSNQLTTLKYRLVKDTYAGAPTYDQLNTLFSSAGTAVASGDVFITGNGGFKTQVMDTPDQMAAAGNSNLLFIVQSGGSSYKYFNVDVAALTY